ncbi:MAG: hypothetical protein K2X81_05740, partial [Candidatus Obscuribacterales bacterium]|nr:hypothetical protein [Candidatus Obscuribacterales bacterium]
MINKSKVLDLLRMSFACSVFMILSSANSVVSFTSASGAAMAKEAETVSPPVSGQLFESRVPTKNRKKKKAQLQWESVKYPIIYWKAHPVTVVPGATGQLITSFEDKEDVLRRGTLK